MIKINIEFKIISHVKMLKYHSSIEYLDQSFYYMLTLRIFYYIVEQAYAGELKANMFKEIVVHEKTA